MSTLKTNNVQVGQSITATNNFTLYQPATPDGTVRLGVGNTGATTADVITANNAGAVGIGVTPTSFATVKALQLNTASTVMAFTDELDVAQNVYYNAGNKYITNAAATLYAQSGGQHLWYRAASGTAGNAISFSENARFTSDGSFCVGTTLTGSKQNLAFDNAGQGGIRILHNSTTYNGPAMQFIRANNSTVMGFIYSDGANTQYSTSSDYRLKENIQPMVGGLDKVMRLKPCTYKWKDMDKAGEGFIAHELQEVVPNAVHGEKDAVNEDGSIKSQGIDTSFLVATLAAAIQELKAELDSVKAELATLKNG